MNTYDILGLTPPADSVVNKYKSVLGGRRRKFQQTLSSNNEEPTTEEKQTEIKTVKPEDLKHNKNITLQNVNNDSVVEVYEPIITRPTISIYEYSEIHTMLGLYLDSLKSVGNYTDEVEIRGNINPVELAYHLLKENKWDATIDRGYEKVSYSKLKCNPQWGREIEHYLEDQHRIQREELFEPLGLI